jgi:hypothetical protein
MLLHSTILEGYFEIAMSLNMRAMNLKNSGKTGYIHTNSMELSPGEAVSRSATQEFPQNFMQPEGSIAFSQEPSTGP